MDRFTAAMSLASVIAALISGLAGALVLRSRIWKSVLTGVVVLVVTAVTLGALDAFDVGPFEDREVVFTDGLGSTGCTTVLQGTATVPAGEDLWVLLFNDASGEFFVQGPRGGPVVTGAEKGDWSLPLQVSDAFYPDATYSLIGVVVPFDESARLQARPRGEAVPAEEFPQTVRLATRGRITLAYDVGCGPPAPP